ncbi:hypothetical protein PSMEN_01635 [Ectopseudomonas mendocina]|jgi:hypothetical protein|nr:hypothetical protein PSMEN_01635 [Pseudomonas mendocina]
MTLRTFAGLGALLSSNSGHALCSRADAGAGDAVAALLCQTLSGLALHDGNAWSPCGARGSAIQIERDNYL